MLDKYLLIVNCTKPKVCSAGTMPAFDRYKFKGLKKAKREGYYPANLDLLILSAKYGLITADTPIENYDLRMTEHRARELQESVSNELDRHLQQNDYQEIFVNLAKEYKIAIQQSQEILNQSERVIYAQDKRKNSDIKRWICAKHQSQCGTTS